MPFERELFIPFHLSDAAGILFFGHVFTLAHQLLETYITEELQIPWQQWFQNPEWMVPIKHAEASYSSPLLVGQPCQALVQVITIKHSSFQLSHHFYQQGQPCCQVNTVHVFCCRTTRTKKGIPDFVRSALRHPSIIS